MVTDLFILPTLLGAQNFGVDVTVEDYAGMLCALSPPMVRWLLMCLTNESAFSMHRYCARNAII